MFYSCDSLFTAVSSLAHVVGSMILVTMTGMLKSFGLNKRTSKKVLSNHPPPTPQDTMSNHASSSLIEEKPDKISQVKCFKVGSVKTSGRFHPIIVQRSLELHRFDRNLPLWQFTARSTVKEVAQ